MCIVELCYQYIDIRNELFIANSENKQNRTLDQMRLVELCYTDSRNLMFIGNNENKQKNEQINLKFISKSLRFILYRLDS